MRNEQIPKFWRNNAPAKSSAGNYWTDGSILYSYQLIIGSTTPTGAKTLYDYTGASDHFISATTSRHVSLATFYADEKLTPGSQDQA
jgi:hypothetical protein